MMLFLRLLKNQAGFAAYSSCLFPLRRHAGQARGNHSENGKSL
jgi:hypothetical protein